MPVCLCVRDPYLLLINLYCCIQDFAAQYRKTRSMENSRRPSEENIYLTPPWMEDERQSCGVSTVS